jgi:mutator protein MutT
LWEFPGGKLEKGETPVDCLARECLEELGVTVEVGQFLGALTHSRSGLDFQLIFYFARIVGGEIIAKVHRQTKWIDFSEIGQYELCPADKDALRLIGFYFFLDKNKIKH